LEKGAPISVSRKQKTNCRSSTEAELVGTYDALPSVLHIKNFLEAMGFEVNKNIIYQDNKSSITLEKHGRASSSKRTKHIKVRYFFIKDMIEQGEVSVEHCPTKEMWADVLTKPLQGYLFYLMRSKLMGCPIYLSEEESLDGAANGSNSTALSPMHHGEGAKSKNNGGVDGSVIGSDVPNGQVHNFLHGSINKIRDTSMSCVWGPSGRLRISPSTMGFPLMDFGGGGAVSSARTVYLLPFCAAHRAWKNSL
jgi:hypothetical protein